MTLERASVEFVQDEDNLGSIAVALGKGEEKMIIPMALKYEFELKNDGKKAVGEIRKVDKEDFKIEGGIEAYIEPSEALKDLSESLLGFNMYDASDNVLGLSESTLPVLEPNQSGDFAYLFTLGAMEENKSMPLAPVSDDLEALKQDAFDAVLVVTVDDEEIARFNLNKFKND